MATDAARTVLEDAWGRIPHDREATVGLGTFTRTRIERVIALVVGFGCLALGAQALITALTAGTWLGPGWVAPMAVLTFVPLAVMIVACGIGRGIRVFAGLFSVSYLVALVLWPSATSAAASPILVEPWIFYLVNVATVASVLAFPLVVQIVWGSVTPLLFGIVRLVQGDWAVELRAPVTLDVSFTLILAGVMITIAWLFRAIAVNVDEARARAVSSYSSAAAAAAAEEERVAVAGLMHDSVLAALIAAERAETPREQHLAVQMAQEALTRLANADSAAQEGSDAPLTADAVAAEVEHAAAELGVSLAVRRDRVDDVPPIPGRVAHALVLAATQAIANSVQHAGAEGLRSSIRRQGASGIALVVSDAGPGFDLAAIPLDRLGIRGSIFARLDAVGGFADIDVSGRGTAVTLSWEPAG